MIIYVMSDIHGYIDEFNAALKMVDLSAQDSKLILLGDYIDGYDSYAVLDRVMQLQKKYGADKVVTLMGNHEALVLEGEHEIAEYSEVGRYNANDVIYKAWMKKLKLYHIEGNHIFVHAGIDEEDDILWHVGTPRHVFYGKYPPTFGEFSKVIIAGHTGCNSIVSRDDFHGISYGGVCYDGMSHYFIDGMVGETHNIPVLMIDTKTNCYYVLTPRTRSGGGFSERCAEMTAR